MEDQVMEDLGMEDQEKGMDLHKPNRNSLQQAVSCK
jgi:hypothetical protein